MAVLTWSELQPAGNNNVAWTCGAGSNDLSVLLAGNGTNLYKSINSGTTWTPVSPGGDRTQNWKGCAVSKTNGSVMFAVATGSYPYVSIDTGTTWATVCPAGNVTKSWSACAIDTDGSNMIASVTGGNVYLSSNTGSAWTTVTLYIGSHTFTSVASDDDGSVLLVVGGS